jgi:hypothetical protein
LVRKVILGLPELTENRELMVLKVIPDLQVLTVLTGRRRMR